MRAANKSFQKVQCSSCSLARERVREESQCPMENATPRAVFRYVNSLENDDGHGPYSFNVASDEFLSNFTYEAVSAPPHVRAEADGIATDVEVIVHRKISAK